MEEASVEDLREEVERLSERVDALERQVDGRTGTEILTNQAVEGWVDEAAAASKYDADRVWDVVMALSALDGDSYTTSEELAELVGLAVDSTSELLRELERFEVVTSRKNPDDRRSKQYALDRDSLRDIVRLSAQG